MSDLFFIASKTLVYLIRVETWIVLGLVLLSWMISRKHYRLAKRITNVMLILFVVGTFIPIGEPLLHHLETRFPVNPPLDRVDGIIVLGGAEDARGTKMWDQTQLNASAERFTEALILARRFPSAKVAFSGGDSSLISRKPPQPGAEVAERFFKEQGIEPERLLFEGNSRNTAENAQFSFATFRPAPDQHWVLITSAFHMPRAMNSFRTAGWKNVTPYPVDFRSNSSGDLLGDLFTDQVIDLNLVLREYVGLLAYHLTKR
jgi:uncharacterized SAM-binding protein YcdF (DUF218 family)